MGIGRVVATGTVLLAGLGVLGACGWDITKERATDESKVTERIESVRFDNGAGNVTITSGDEPSVARVIHYEDEQPADTHRVEDGVLILDSCPTEDCWIDYEVVVPEGVTVDGSVQSGNAEIVGVASVNVRASSGEVTVRDVDGDVNAEASSGDVDLSAIRGTTQVRSSSGDVTVALDAPHDVRVDVNSGNVDVRVPSGSYRVDASTSSGEVDNELGSDTAAGHHIDLHSDSGNITITRA